MGPCLCFCGALCPRGRFTGEGPESHRSWPLLRPRGQAQATGSGRAGHRLLGVPRWTQGQGQSLRTVAARHETQGPGRPPPTGQETVGSPGLFSQMATGWVAHGGSVSPQSSEIKVVVAGPAPSGPLGEGPSGLSRLLGPPVLLGCGCIAPSPPHLPAAPSRVSSLLVRTPTPVMGFRARPAPV